MMDSTMSMLDGKFETFRPEVRRDALVYHYDKETVAWSPIGRDPIALDPVAAVLFRLLDGTASVGDLIADVHEVIGIPVAVARNQISRVISQLQSGGLLMTSAAEFVPDLQLDLFPAPPNP